MQVPSLRSLLLKELVKCEKLKEVELSTLMSNQLFDVLATFFGSSQAIQQFVKCDQFEEDFAQLLQCFYRKNTSFLACVQSSYDDAANKKTTQHTLALLASQLTKPLILFATFAQHKPMIDALMKRSVMEELNRLSKFATTCKNVEWLDWIKNHLLLLLDKLSSHPDFNQLFFGKKDDQWFYKWLFEIIIPTNSTVTTSDEKMREENRSHSKQESGNNANNSAMQISCATRIVLRQIQIETQQQTTKENIPTDPSNDSHIVQCIVANVSFFDGLFATLRHNEKDEILANVALILKHVVAYCKTKKEGNMFKKSLVTHLPCIMDLLRSKVLGVRKNGALLLSQIATWDDTMKESVRSVGGITALMQLHNEVVKQ
ncbi:hypothetical protein RFI_29201 [Reticulomyxa filosa]|uniref:Uncharacterized protein n=1 Tax=Reticulomyxa filosa TaxID=46433 RepID=X6M1Y3_RETFI|nr:hypothetical protein RFI_29201 [Reticulomyxa filosa]|eukprot:ETO08188.1 hypothetical protein RFI_29201 [Reticulomyxa filosa]